MVTYSSAAFSTLVLLFVLLIYTTSRLLLINNAKSGEINLKMLLKKINFGANFFLFLEMVVSTISVIPPLTSPILFILSSIATGYDIYLLSKEKLLIKFPELAKKLEKVINRFEIKMWSHIVAIVYVIYLIIRHGYEIKNQRYGKFSH